MGKPPPPLPVGAVPRRTCELRPAEPELTRQRRGPAHANRLRPAGRHAGCDVLLTRVPPPPLGSQPYELHGPDVGDTATERTCADLGELTARWPEGMVTSQPGSCDPGTVSHPVLIPETWPADRARTRGTEPRRVAHRRIAARRARRATRGRI
jgi:hypothetical protein